MHKRQAGLSVMELVTIMGIVAVLATIAVPNIVSATRAYKLSNASNALVQQLNLSRQLAVRGNRPTQVRFTIQPESAYLTAQPYFDNDGNFVFETVGGPVSAVSSDTGVTLSSANALTNGTVPIKYYSVIFTSRGDLKIGDPTPTFTLTYKGRNRNVSVDTRGGVTLGPEY